MTPPHVLLVGADPRALDDILADTFALHYAQTADEARAILGVHAIAVLLCALDAPGWDGPLVVSVCGLDDAPEVMPIDPGSGPETEALRCLVTRAAERHQRRFADHLETCAEARAHLERALAEARAKSRAKSAFLANMSHEIRTPMNAIMGFSQHLVRLGGLTPEQLTHLEHIQVGGRHLLSLVNNVLDLAQIDGRKMEVRTALFNLSDTLNDVLAIASSRADTVGLDLSLTVAASVPAQIHADEAKLRHILLNLLNNAVKFTAEGHVHLTAQVEHTSPRPMVHIEIEDTGPGMSPADLLRVFLPFEQAAAGQRVGGTGLGLAISRRLAETIDGTLTATSELDVGGVFQLRFPIAPEDIEGTTTGILQTATPTPQTWQPADIPAELRPALREATTIGDLAQVVSLATQIKDPALSARICRLAAHFDYERLGVLFGLEMPDD